MDLSSSYLYVCGVTLLVLVLSWVNTNPNGKNVLTHGIMCVLRLIVCIPLWCMCVIENYLISPHTSLFFLCTILASYHDISIILVCFLWYELMAVFTATPLVHKQYAGALPIQSKSSHRAQSLGNSPRIPQQAERGHFHFKVWLIFFSGVRTSHRNDVLGQSSLLFPVTTITSYIGTTD